MPNLRHSLNRNYYYSTLVEYNSVLVEHPEVTTKYHSPVSLKGLRAIHSSTVPWGYPCGSAADWTSSDHDAGSSCRGGVGHLGAAESSESLLHLKEQTSCCLWGEGQTFDAIPILKKKYIYIHIHFTKDKTPFYPIQQDQSQTISDVTWQERLLHGLHQTLQVMFYIVHHNIDLVHITSNNDFLKQVKKVGLHLEGTLKDTQVPINVLNKQRPLTLTVTMFGCWAFRIVLISLKDVMGKPSFSFSIFNLFKATISSANRKPLSLFHQLTQSENKRKWTYMLIFIPVFLSLALYTTP